MRSIRRVRVNALVVSTVAVLILSSACGGASDGEETGGQGGGSIVASIGEPESLMTSFSNETFGQTVLRSVYEGLVDYDPKTREPVNALAESITTEDSVVWTVKIKPGYTFDNGEPVDTDSFFRSWNYAAYGPHAQDNAYFFERIVGYADLQSVDPDGEDGPAEAPEPKATKLSGLKKVDDRTFQITLSNPFSNFPIMLGYNAFYPMAKACADDLEACNEKPIGDGPFKLDGSWEHGQQIKVVRSDTYAGEKPKLDQITFRIYDKIDTAYLDMQAGELDVLNAVPAAKFKDAVDKYGDRMIRQPNSEFQYLALPYYVPALNNPKLRKALSMSIDREAIIDALFNSQYVPAKGVISPVVPGSRPDACKESCTYNPAKAKQLLAEAGGWPAGKKLELWCNAGRGHEKWLQAVGDQIRRNLGIDYELRCDLQLSQYLAKLDNDEVTGPFRLTWLMDYPSPENYIKPMYVPHGPGNFSRYDNPKVSDLVRSADSADSLEASIPLYQQAEDTVLEDLPLIPLWFGVSSIVTSERVSNVILNPAKGVVWENITTNDGQ